MTDKMGKKELLEELDMGIYWVEGGMCEQAHDQLKAIIKQHFREAMPENPYPIGHDEFEEVKVHGEQSEAQSSVDEELIEWFTKFIEEGFAGGMSWDLFCRAQERLNRIKQLLQSQRAVTKSELKAWATELQNKANARPRKAERVLNKMLKELGIEVIE